MANVAFVSASAELERLGVGADKQYDVIATSTPAIDTEVGEASYSGVLMKPMGVISF